MKKILLILLLFKPLFIYSQVNEITFNHQRINFSAAPRTAISPMSIKMWDNYQNGGPSTWGTVLEFYGYNGHQTGQLYFGGLDNSRIRYREAFYAQNTWSDWMTLLDSKNDVESGGNLKINGTGNHYILNGNVGIGTSSPFAKLSVSEANRGIEFTPYLEGGNGAVLEIIDRNDYSKRIDLNFYIGNNGGNIKFYTSASEKARITKEGNMLIGKMNQIETGINYKLDVAGRIRADEIVVNTTGADFVFEPTYKLRTLSELETFIHTNKHLPDIAPAKEMQENGVSAGEMQAKLLQKVEELTLYMIEKDKELKDQKEINSQQQLMLLELKKEIETLKKLTK